MVHTRSGLETAIPGDNESSQPGVDIPGEVQVPAITQGEVPQATTPQVYTAGTYTSTLQREAALQGTPRLRRTPSVPNNFRPSQFAFLPAPDFSTARQPSDAEEEKEETHGVSPMPPRIVNLGEPSPDSKPAATPQGFMRTLAFEAPMRPLDVARGMYLDYTTTQSIKFYNKGCEKLPGEAFNGKLLLTWLVQVQDKARMFTWIPILTIKGKLLTQQFADLSMDEVRTHAQIYQNKSSREAQNSEMLIHCLKASISRTVYNKVYLQRSKYIIYRDKTHEPIEDGVCFLKTIIDNYHSNTRSSTKQIRKQMAQLNYYMRNVAKGDVSKLCEHTRELSYELNAAGETTNDLLANLIEALKEAPDTNFQRWLGNQVDLWSMRKIDWKEDGSDLMEDAETYYLEAINTHKWGKRAHKQEVQYAFEAVESEVETEVEKEKSKVQSYEDTIKALTTQLQEYATAYTAKWSGSPQENLDKKWAWKRTPPKAGEPSCKKVHADGKSKTYYWCPYHNQWTIHTPAECRKVKIRKRENKSKKVHKKTSNFKEKKQAYIQAKAAYKACMNNDEEEESSISDNEEDSNKSNSTYSSENSNVS
jgi:hypothetical protein